MDDRLPLFPLGTVLFPGVTLPLHVFERRYRQLVDDLLALPSDRSRRFGVVAIELGHEVGDGAARSIARTGCTAELRDATRHDDGRLDIVARGVSRFRIDEIDDSRPYLRAGVTTLPEEAGPDAELGAPLVSRLLREYYRRLGRLGVTSGSEVGTEADAAGELPEDPLWLSYVAAEALVVERTDKQRLLDAEHAAARLRLECELLRRENKLVTALPSLPARGVASRAIHPN